MNIATGQLCKAPPSGITGLTCDLYPLSTSGGKYSTQKEGTGYNKEGVDYPQALLNSNFLLKSYGPLQCWPKVEFVRNPLEGSSEYLYDSVERTTYSPHSIDSDMSSITKHFNGHEGNEDSVAMTDVCDDIKLSNGINRCCDVNTTKIKNKNLPSQSSINPISNVSSGGAKARRPLLYSSATPSSGVMKRNPISKSNGTEPIGTKKISSTRRTSSGSSLTSTGNTSSKTSVGTKAVLKSDHYLSKQVNSTEKLNSHKLSYSMMNGSKESVTAIRKNGVGLIERTPSASLRKTSAGIGSRTNKLSTGSKEVTNRPSTGSSEATPTSSTCSKSVTSPSLVNKKIGTKLFPENSLIAYPPNKTDSPEQTTSLRQIKNSTTVTSRYSAERSKTESESRKRRTEYEKTRVNNERKREEKSDVRKKNKEEEKRKLSKEEKKRVEDTRKPLLERREKAKEIKREGNREEKKSSVEIKSRVKKREEPKRKEQQRTNDKEKKKSETERRTSEISQQNLQRGLDVGNENNLEGSDSELYTMVQENGMMKVVSKSSPLKPIRSPIASDQDVDKLEQEKRERIQRYKEERRKQMAVRYGINEQSSSDEENSNATQSAYRRKRRHRPGLDSSSTDLSMGEGKKNHENGSNQAKEGSSSEDLRNKQSAKRLDPLNGSTTILTSPTLVAKNAINAASAARDDNKGYGRRENAFDQSLQRIASQEGRVDSADSTLSGSDGRGGRRRRTSTEERDKSYKRKSHLNRASTSEEAVYPPHQNISQLSDSSEDAPRRRRRRTPIASDNLFTSSPLVTPPTTGAADSPISRIAQSKKSQVAQPPSLFPPLKSPSLLTAHGLPSTGSHSAPSTLDVRSKSDVPQKSGADAEDVVLKNSFANKLTPLKITPLRKPEIPSVLRPKEPTVTSPGVLHTPASRPSSVVIEKPPLQVV